MFVTDLEFDTTDMDELRTVVHNLGLTSWTMKSSPGRLVTL